MRKSYWKKRQMRRTVWAFYFSVGIFAVPCPGWSAGLTPSMSGQELLQYTLDDLRAAINKATGENEKLRERNQGLQEKLNQLKKVHDALADQKKVLMDQAAELRTKAESADREMVTLQEKVKQLSQSAIVRREEVQGLRTDVVAAREVLRDLQQKSPALQKEISEKSQYLTDELPAQLKKQAKEKRPASNRP